MSRPLRIRLAATVCVLATLTLSGAASRDIAPDAISRATTWNAHLGVSAWLTDGILPPEDADAFVWQGKGVLAFEWGEVLAVKQVRLRLGAADSDFKVRTYIGGRLLEDGSSRDPRGELTATAQDLSGTADAWITISLPAGTRADNLELETLGITEIYEVEILVPVDDLNPTAVEQVSWARVKSATWL